MIIDILVIQQTTTKNVLFATESTCTFPLKKCPNNQLLSGPWPQWHWKNPTFLGVQNSPQDLWEFPLASPGP